MENFIREKLGFMMYNHGRGEVITKTEYLRWKYRHNEKVFHLFKILKCEKNPFLKTNENSMLNSLKLFTDKGKFFLEVLNLIRWDF